MPTIAEEIRVWEKTNGHLNRDFENLFYKLIEYSQRNSYDLVIKTPDYSKTTFHELKVPLTIKEAKERYMKEDERAIAPDFIDLVNKVEEHNNFCDSKNNTTEYYRKKIKEIEITDYMNFLYFAERISQNVGYHDTTKIIKQGFRKLFGKKEVRISDPNPIVIATNPKKDGLLGILKENLTHALVRWNRGLRVFYLGDDGESLRDFYSNSNIKDFDFVNCHFKNPADEYFGIWTNKGYVEGRFSGETDLLGIENKIKGKFVFGGWSPKLEHSVKLRLFNNFKRKIDYVRGTVKDIRKVRGKIELCFLEDCLPDLSIHVSETGVKKNLVEKLRVRDVLDIGKRIEDKPICPTFPNPINRILLVHSNDPKLYLKSYKKPVLIVDSVPYYLLD